MLSFKKYSNASDVLMRKIQSGAPISDMDIDTAKTYRYYTPNHKNLLRGRVGV